MRDLDIIAEELRLKDEDNLMKHLEKLERTVLRGSDKKQKPDYVRKPVLHKPDLTAVSSRVQNEPTIKSINGNNIWSINQFNNVTQIANNRPRVMFYNNLIIS